MKAIHHQPIIKDWTGLLVLVAALAAAPLVTGCTVHATTRPAHVSGGVVVYTQPPPPRRVVVSARPVAPYHGAVWIDGHWVWRGNQYVWVNGRWIRPRTGYVYVQPRWERRGNGWVHVQGSWRAGPAHRTTVRARTPPPRQGSGNVRVRVR